MKPSKSNPCFYVNLDDGIIGDEFGNRYGISDFKQLVANSEEPLDMTLMAQRLISLNYDMNKLRNFYKENP